MRGIAGFLSVCLLMASGCTSKRKTILPSNAIAIQSNGIGTSDTERKISIHKTGLFILTLPISIMFSHRFLSREGGSIEKRKLAERDYVNHVDNIISEIKQQAPVNGKIKVMIFIHGGLNSGKDGSMRAKELTPKLIESGYYPIFINWRSSLLSSYSEYLRSKRAFLPLYVVEDLARAVVRLPYWVLSPGTVSVMFSTNVDRFRPEITCEDLQKDSSDGQCGIQIYEGKRASMSMLSMLLRAIMTYPRMVSSPIIESMGSNAYRYMKRRTRLMFRTDVEYIDPIESSRLTDPEAHRRMHGAGGVAIFMHHLEEAANSSSTPWEITLVGHSMGAIILNKIVRSFGEIKYSRIVYMAAACTIRDYQASLYPYLARNRGTQMMHLTLHPRAEYFAQHSWIRSLYPQGSLLVWIDGFLDAPLTYLDRTAGRLNNIKGSLKDTPLDIRCQVSVRAFGVGGAGRGSEPQHHGDFATKLLLNEELWLPKRPTLVDDCAQLVKK